MTERPIYHLCRKADWDEALRTGRYGGSAQDRRDGFIHFSTAAQIRASAAKHHAGKPDLLLIEVDAGRLGETLRWEASRGGALFPHLYGDLPLTAVLRADPLPLDPASGEHLFPELR
jgi:uncharacterized protein (DUF952 family)